MKSTVLKITRFLIILLFMILLFAAFHKKTPIETDIAQGFLNPNIEQENNLLSLAKLSSQNLSVIIETENFEKNEELKSQLNDALSKTNIKHNSIENFENILNVYKAYPENFLTEKTRKLLIKRDFNSVDENSLHLLYNPLSVYIQTPDKDPYLFATDYVLNLQTPYLSENSTEYNGKYYSKIPLKITNKETLNLDMKTLVAFQNQINKNKSSKIYITGTPIHTYKTSKNSSFEINILCLLSTITLIFLCKKYFKSLKILVPVISSIAFGIIAGYLVTSICISKIYILTFVFATSLIGISLDYSVHYIFSQLSGKSVLKSITISMLTTIFSFLILCFSGIDLLKQIGIFTISGLISVYLFVFAFLPMLKKFFPLTIQTIQFPDLYRYKKGVICIVLLVISLGFVRLKFDDNLKNMYSPQRDLLKAEVLNNTIFHIPHTTFIVVKGDNIEKILEKEEQVSDKLASQNLEYISLNKLIPSVNRQKENRKLVQDLYDKNLKTYATFISTKSINELKESLKYSTFISPDKFPVEKFKLNSNSSYMIVFGENPNLHGISNINIIDISDNFSNILKIKRIKCLKLLPIIFSLYFIFLSLCYNSQKALKIIAGPMIGAIFAICIISAFGGKINMFHILSIFLILGFSLDYSVFMANGGKYSMPPVFISFISSFISFMLLSFTSFKLISSMGLVLSIGLLISYIFSILLFSNADTENT